MNIRLRLKYKLAVSLVETSKSAAQVIRISASTRDSFGFYSALETLMLSVIFCRRDGYLFTDLLAGSEYSDFGSLES